jgi:hypothetical protein
VHFFATFVTWQEKKFSILELQYNRTDVLRPIPAAFGIVSSNPVRRLQEKIAILARMQVFPPSFSLGVEILRSRLTSLKERKKAFSLLLLLSKA